MSWVRAREESYCGNNGFPAQRLGKQSLEEMIINYFKGSICWNPEMTYYWAWPVESSALQQTDVPSKNLIDILLIFNISWRIWGYILTVWAKPFTRAIRGEDVRWKQMKASQTQDRWLWKPRPPMRTIGQCSKKKRRMDNATRNNGKKNGKLIAWVLVLASELMSLVTVTMECRNRNYKLQTETRN